LLFLGDFQQVDGGGHGREAFLREGRSGGGTIGRDAFGEVADYLIAASRGSTCEAPRRTPIAEARDRMKKPAGKAGFGGNWWPGAELNHRHKDLQYWATSIFQLLEDS
jgi:hypothetical protein